MRRKLMVALAAVAITLVAATAAAWAVDRTRGVGLAGHKVSGAPGELVRRIADGYATTPVVVHTGSGDLRSTAGDLGITVDVDATRAAVDDARSGGPLDWFRGVAGRREAPLIVVAEAERMRSVVRAKDPTDRTDAVEPAVRGSADGIAVVKGKPGRGLDPAAVADALRHAARGGNRPVEVDVEPAALAPRFSVSDAERLAADARRVTADPLTVAAGGVQATIGKATLRSWVRSTDDLELALDGKRVADDLADALSAARVPAVDATVRVDGGQLQVVPGTAGQACCADDSPDRILAALGDRPSAPVALALRRTQPDRTTEDVQKLKIAEPVGSFTTRYQAGQSRVANIHRIADLIDNTLIGPGGRLSVNDKVGKRTTDKGFVGGGSIVDGTFVDSVGGGISQFATTLFNAAFFAGLDIPSYQSHSIYISRYPYGREATLSWPKPDLVVKNTTPYGVLVDTSYTSTSVTVTLWSTKYATGEQTGQSESPIGTNGCKRVKTERTRNYVDGTTKVDAVYATYRPAEGVKC